MVGGIIVEIRTIHSRKVWINVEERPLNGSHKPGTCAIYVNPTTPDGQGAWKPKCGDALWWQGGNAMWTPKDANGDTLDPEMVDVPLVRIGYSGVARPDHRA